MGWKGIVGLFIVLLIAMILVFYWLVPLNVEFITGNINSNFSVNPGLEKMQFYPDMRFPTSNLSYRIYSNCPSEKSSEMKNAFDVLSRLTPLRFYPVDSNEEVSITCSNEIKPEGGDLFIAGEGGPTKIIAGDKFNVIFQGEILLLFSSSCSIPVVPIHELLHVLGFQHSMNPRNIMYNVTSCVQDIGDDTITLLNELYSYPSLPDMEFGNSSARMHGRYIDLNMTVINDGLADSQPFTVDIYADNSLIKEINMDPIKIGEGEEVAFTNIFVARVSVSQLKMNINYNFDELEKDNNQIILNVRQ
jgi:hypothetical protein